MPKTPILRSLLHLRLHFEIISWCHLGGRTFQRSALRLLKLFHCYISIAFAKLSLINYLSTFCDGTKGIESGWGGGLANDGKKKTPPPPLLEFGTMRTTFFWFFLVLAGFENLATHGVFNKPQDSSLL